ncbi:MAG TPA: hypothetical protein PKY59_09325 [Pyrinomonadaceae bacterium]|nr:hypothetical protein [Pyrinomonadaceae bacterium]
MSILSKISLENGVAICFMITCGLCFVLTSFAQPTSLREFNAPSRQLMTEGTQIKIDALTEQIEKDRNNVALYRKRLRLYFDLIELNFDNRNWTIYADKSEADLSLIIELEETPENYLARANWLSERLRRSPPAERVVELYPDNQYFNKAAADYLKAIQLDSDSKNLVSVYTNLSGLYVIRPYKLAASPNFQARRTKIPLKLVRNDFDNSIKYGQLALEISAKMSSADVLRENLATTFMLNINTAVKLKDFQTALGFYESGKNFSITTSSCAYYAGWGNIYLKLKKFDKAIEIFNAVSQTENPQCVDLIANRGDAFAAKGESEKALSDYIKALTIDEKDSLQKIGWVYIKKAKLLLKLGKTEQALSDLNNAVEKEYIADCPSVYRIRAKIYGKLGKRDLAKNDIQNANKLKNQANCLSE